jgi:hypothetical protein
MDNELAKAVRASLRYDGLGNLGVLRQASGLTGVGFSALRRGRHPIAPAAARRIARTFRLWATACERRAARIIQTLQPEAPDVRA